jgi:hypothetical protein
MRSPLSWSGRPYSGPVDMRSGQPAEFLASAADQAVRAAEALDRSDVGLAIDVTSLSPDESASVIRDAIGWPWPDLTQYPRGAASTDSSLR